MAREEDTAAILRLVRTVHAGAHPELNEAYWNWRYLSHTTFRAQIVIAEHDGQPIGIQPMAVFDWQWCKDRFRGAMYTGVMTHPNHRRRGVFRTLVRCANDNAAQCGAHFSMTLPNDASLPGFLGSGEWRYPGLIPLYLKVFKETSFPHSQLASFSERLMMWCARPVFRKRCVMQETNGLDYALAESMDDEIESVFDHYAEECRALMIRRTAAFWNWRYASHPESIYRTWLVKRNHRMMGAVVVSVKTTPRFDIGMIIDLVAQGGVPVIRGLLGKAEEDLRSRGIRLVTCQATTSPLQTALREEGYRRLPAWLIRKRFHFVYRPTGIGGPRDLPDVIPGWHLMFSDSDNA